MTSRMTVADDGLTQSRVQRSFAFIDLCGFTSFTDAQGDGAAVDVLTEFRLRVREIAARRGVRIAKWLGDGAMLVAVDVEPLAEAIVDMEEVFADAPLAMRAGMASGPVILFEGDDYIGYAVNLAARLCGAATAGEMLAPAPMMAGVDVRGTVTPIGARQVHGFSEPVELVRIDPEQPARV